ncbi:MAG: 16S rRNA (cytosine(967)-C(5))-methyltransferase RsmB [bacterium]
MNHRLLAAKVIGDVLKGASLSRALPQRLDASPAEKPRVQALVYGVLRHYERLNFFASQLLSKPPRARDDIVRILLLIGLFELEDQRTPPHAVVKEVVNTVRGERNWAAGVVNACLRRFQREKSGLEDKALNDVSADSGLPSWLAEAIQDAWPAEFPDIAEAMKQAPPMTLRVNLDRGSREGYQQRLKELGLVSTVHPEVDSALVLESATDIDSLPGFENGDVSVQDAAAQQAAELLMAKPNMRVLDACAAPGGKTGHILEACGGNLDLLALESDAARSRRIDETLKRLGYSATVVVADAGDLGVWWDGKPFHRVLLDAPCSATGTLRRNPDIKRHRTSDDIAVLVGLQQRLLTRLWETVAPGGRLVYATCSLMPQENDDQIAAFVKQTPNAQAVPLSGNWGRDLSYGRQVLPGDQGMDGFYYAVLMKV